MPPTGDAYNIDWIFSKTSNAHIANHREWFTSITTFALTLASGTKVEGIGDVALPAKTSPTQTGKQGQRTLLLKDVCYAPTMICNILGGPILKEYEVDTMGAGASLRHSETRARSGILDEINERFRLRLKGQSGKESSLEDGVHVVHADLPEEERVRWEARKALLVEEAQDFEEGKEELAEGALGEEGKGYVAKKKRSKGKWRGESRCWGANKAQLAEAAQGIEEGKWYSAKEKQYLEDTWGGESKFLKHHQLSVHEEEDRANGRAIAQVLIENERETPSETGTKPESAPADLESELEEDVAAYAADYQFSAEQLEWIKENFGSSKRFLEKYGLKCYDAKECKLGQEILDGLMRNPRGEGSVGGDGKKRAG